MRIRGDLTPEEAGMLGQCEPSVHRNVLVLRIWSEHTGPKGLWSAGPAPTGREGLARANPKAKLRAFKGPAGMTTLWD